MAPVRKVEKPDACEFVNCTNHRRSEDGFPKEIAIINIARLNREYVEASFASGENSGKFSSNQSIRDSCERIWKVKPVKVKLE